MKSGIKQVNIPGGKFLHTLVEAFRIHIESRCDVRIFENHAFRVM